MNDEWYTPPIYIESVRKVMGSIDTDPASCTIANATVKATTYYSINDSAFNHHWYGKVWINPPYSRIISKFIDKLIDEFKAGHTTEAIILTNSGTDTKWMHQLFSVSTAHCFTKGRIAFLDQQGNAIANNNKGQVFTYIGPNKEKFRDEFSKYGAILYT